MKRQTKTLNFLQTQYESNENHLKSELFEKDRVIHKQQTELEGHRESITRLLNAAEKDSVNDVIKLIMTSSDTLTKQSEELNLISGDLSQRKQTLDSMKHELSEANDSVARFEDLNGKLKSELYNSAVEVERLRKELESSESSWVEERTAVMKTAQV